MPAGISKRWYYVSHIYPLYAQGQQNHSRLLWVLSSGELIHQEGSTVITFSADRVWVRSRSPLWLYLASLSPYFTDQEPRQREGWYHWLLSALAIAWPQAHMTRSPPCILKQHIKDCKWWATSWGVIHNCQAPLFYPCEKSSLQDSTYSLPWEGPSNGRVTFSLLLTSS